FVKGNYDRGLPLLARSTDAALKDLARRDLAGPKAAKQQAELADDWYTRAEAEKGLTQRQTLRRAFFWYQQAQPGLGGLTRIRVHRLVDELGRLFPTGATPTLAPVEITAEVRTFNLVHGGMFTALALSGDGKLLLSGGNDNSLRLWDAVSGEKKFDLPGHTG